MKNLKLLCYKAIPEHINLVDDVDRADQRICCYSHGKTSKKWWKLLFRFVFNTVI